MATLGTRGLEAGGLAAELATQIAAAAQVASEVQTRETVVHELRSGDDTRNVYKRFPEVTDQVDGSGSERRPLRTDERRFNPASTMRSHESQANLQRLLNDGWRIDHSFPSSYVIQRDSKFDTDHQPLLSTIIVLSRPHRQRCEGGYVLGSS